MTGRDEGSFASDLGGACTLEVAFLFTRAPAA